MEFKITKTEENTKKEFSELDNLKMEVFTLKKALFLLLIKNGAEIVAHGNSYYITVQYSGSDGESKELGKIYVPKTVFEN